MGESLRVLNAKYRSSLESPFHVHPYIDSHAVLTMSFVNLKVLKQPLYFQLKYTAIRQPNTFKHLKLVKFKYSNIYNNLKQ